MDHPGPSRGALRHRNADRLTAYLRRRILCGRLRLGPPACPRARPATSRRMSALSALSRPLPSCYAPPVSAWLRGRVSTSEPRSGRPGPASSWTRRMKYCWKVQHLPVPAHVRLPSWRCSGVLQRHNKIARWSLARRLGINPILMILTCRVLPVHKLIAFK